MNSYHVYWRRLKHHLSIWALIIYTFSILVIFKVFIHQSDEIFMNLVKQTPITEEPSPVQFIPWTKNSDLNVSHYLAVEPQFHILPKRLYTNTEVIVLVASHPKGQEAREAIRKTWAKPDFLRKHKAEVNFVLGVEGYSLSEVINEEAEQHQDILVVNVLDSYMNLTLKSVFMLKYLSDITGLYEGLQTALKTDDDCYVNIPGLLHLAKNHVNQKVIIGTVLGFGTRHNYQPVLRPNTSDETIQDKWSVPFWMYPADHFPSSVSGTGYLFPLSIADCLIKQTTKVPFLKLEDVYVTGLLAKSCEVTLKHSQYFLYMGMDDYSLWNISQNIILVHRVVMEKMHDLFHEYWRYHGLLEYKLKTTSPTN